ncbi:MAG TPA: extracellular solute-binding protein [Burkholderiales bacterium]|jgi:ABC-type Fe3+ transport system substrate-binding protein|nr:extracellular solute-binding protein [Burkholderiales bacterium]
MRVAGHLKALLALLLAGAASAGMAEGRVVVLTSYPQETISLFEAAFEKANPGTRLEIVWRMPRDAMPYLLDAGSHGVDVYWSASARNYAELAAKDLLAPLAADPALPERIGRFPISDPGLRYRASEIASYGFACNESKLRADRLTCPATWADLAKPGYAGRILLPVPSKVGFAPLMYEILLQKLGWEAGWKVIAEAAANSVLFVPGGAFITDRIGAGEEDVGVTIDFFAKSAIANGAPMTFVYPDVIGFSPAHVAILASAPHPDEAHRYVEFLLSEEGQRILAHPDIRKLPVRPSAYAAVDAGGLNPFDPARSAAFDYDMAAAQKRQALVNALFDAMVSDRHAGLRELSQAIQQAEALAQQRGDANLASAAGRARSAMSWVPVSAMESIAPDLQKNAGERAVAWGREIDARREGALAELRPLLSRTDPPALAQARR